MTTQYPVNFSYDSRDGQILDGWARSADEAVYVAENAQGPDWRQSNARLTTCEVGATCRTREEFERHWRKEIDAGWVSPIQVYAGWRGEATFWATDAHEIDVEE